MVHARWLGALLLWMAATVPAWAAQRALLVGVSELVNQPQALWLQAPRNDVMLMRNALQKHGFAATDITTLADGVSGAALPDAGGETGGVAVDIGDLINGLKRRPTKAIYPFNNARILLIWAIVRQSRRCATITLAVGSE